jgi:hypothetical protein
VDLFQGVRTVGNILICHDRFEEPVQGRLRSILPKFNSVFPGSSTVRVQNVRE